MTEVLFTQIVEVFAIGFTDFAEDDGLEFGEALAIIGPDLGHEPMGFAATASAAVTDVTRTCGMVAGTGDGTGGELPGLEHNVRPLEIADLVRWATESGGEGSEVGKHRGGRS